jgi:hypothetical protein
VYHDRRVIVENEASRTSVRGFAESQFKGEILEHRSIGQRLRTQMSAGEQSAGERHQQEPAYRQKDEEDDVS